MELDATILERLQELRRWQVEQQSRLMKQQQEQREMLSYEQDRMYQALGLSVQSVVSDDSVADKISGSPDNDVDMENSVRDDAIGESSRHESYTENDRSDESVAHRERINDAAMITQSPMGLKVPSLQFNTKRYLDYKFLTADSFSPRSEIPSDCENLVGTANSQRTPEKDYGRTAELSIDGVEPLPAEKPSLKHLAIDDLPVPSPKKDFTTLLEERLRDCEAMPDEQSGPGAKTVIKRPFLKKGEGLARFKPNPGSNAEPRRMRPRSSSLSANMHLSSASATKTNAPKSKDNSRTTKTVGSASTKNLVVPSAAQSKLNLKNVPPPKRKVRSKSMSAVPINRSNNVNHEKPKTHVDMNVSSDFEAKQRRESEEMRIFELLEEKAENSSFCSNSSTVLALFRQSTPLKPKNLQKNNRDSKQQQRSTITNHESSDTSIEEIVRTTRSNKSTTNSPITKIRETVVQKNILFSKWDSGPFANENTNGNSPSNNAKRVVQRSLTAGSYKTMQHTKHTTIQFNNNNNNNTTNNKNNNNRKPVVHSDDEDAGSISRGTKVAHENNFSIEDDEKSDELPADNEEPNVSLHVRFSEYNEYKTIGLTDTSIMSNDANSARDYMEDRAWSDRSTSPDSSDVEVLFANEKPIIRSMMSKARNVSSSSNDDKQLQTRTDESIEPTTDDEQYTSTCSTDNSYDGDNTLSEVNRDAKKIVTRISESDDATDVCNDSGSTIKQENDDVTNDGNENVDKIDVNDTIFKSELLKTRLLELEREIDIFRKENASLANQRKKLQEEHKQLEKDYKRKFDDLDKERKNADEAMQDEKKRLSREKSALEMRLRDAREKSLQTKQERSEMQSLRQQLDELREDFSQKESRWQAAQARQKSQIRVLQTENGKLKLELEKLRQSRTNGSRFRRSTSNTREIHRINKHLDEKKKFSPKKDSSSDEEEEENRNFGTRANHENCDDEEVQPNLSNDDDKAVEVNDDGSKLIVYKATMKQSSKNDNDIEKKRNLYTDLLNEATEGLRGREEICIGKTVEKTTVVNCDDDDNRFGCAINDAVDKLNAEKSFKRNCGDAGETNAMKDGNYVGRTDGETLKSPMAVSRTRQTGQREAIRSPDRRAPNESASSGKQDIREVVCPDGHVEYWYPNGNVKKVFPDRNVTKTIYYNGDVRENAEDGSVKYFYASTRTWHTTLPDGLEILEFPDGQVERRTKNGTVEVSFPDGSVRLLQADGTEKWVLPDGTVAETFPDGDRILSFPNGQREVHTKEHKRREYPDGTVKLVYPDGTQETRYSTGRVRVKDKDGNLIMDVHHRS